MHSRSLKLALAFLLAVFVISALPAWAQSTNTGTVVGSVTDPTGAVVSGATVTITDISTGNARTDATNSAGRYIFVDVNPGIYKLAITKAGFQTTQTERLEVKVGAAVTVNLTLTVGGASTVVEVTAVGNELQTMNATIGNTITSLTIDNLPSLGRDVSTFVELQPGVGPDGSVAGAVLDQSYFSLDGGNNTNDMDGSMNVYTTSYAGDPTGGVATQNNLGAGSGGPTGVLPTPQDSVEEFKVNTAGQTADFNSSAGSEVKVVTKRGTNAWHGTGYEYYKDNNWSSNSWENNFAVPTIPLPSFHYNRFGGAIGGPLIPKEVLGGKTYVFFNYEGFHWPLSQTIQRNVPSAALRLGLLTDDVTGTYYNLNPYSVTYNGTTYPGTGTTIDPRGIGIDPLVKAIFNTYEPASNTTCQQNLCDSSAINPPNIAGFSANIATPTTSRFMVGRVDHDFSKNWHFMSSYRVYRLSSDTTEQVDIGGGLPGDTLGTPASLSNVPQNAAIWVASLTTNISANVTNDVHYSFLRNWWQWQRAGDVPQTVPSSLGGTLAGALEIFSGQSATQDLGPYNVNTQQTRTRFWDGHDQLIRDDISWLKGNHLLQMGGTYQHNFNWHSRTDNGGGINYEPVYELGKGAAGSGLSSVLPLCDPTLSPGVTISNCDSLTAAALGIVSLTQTAYTRSGANLTLNPPLTPAFDKVVIPYYNTYFSDTWHMKPSFTLTYGLGWTLEMPPTEQNGKSVVLVDQANQPVSTLGYLESRRRAALAGLNYNPEIGFALIGNVGNSPKYPYNPFYGEFSPRIAAAWSPHFEGDTLAAKLFGREDTVIRGGYGRVYGRLNGVDLVLVPLLGTGLIQPVQNLNPIIGPAGVPSSASNAFRIGTDGLASGVYSASLGAPPSATLPQPDFPGFNAIPAATGEGLDPNFRPNVVDSFNLTVQRQLSRKVTLEFGYIGRRITHEYQPINLNAVPYMTTMGGQTFSNAYKNVVMQYCGGIAGLAGGNCAANTAAVQPQPFFESAMSPAYCAGYTSCTAAVVAREGGNVAFAQVWSLWSDIDSGVGCGAGCVVPNSNGVNASQGFATLGNTMMNTIQGPYNGGSPQMTSGASLNASVGYGNYNAGFFSIKMADWRGLTAQSNFTYSKALGTGADVQATSEYTPDDPFNLATTYGYQNFNRKFVYNFFFVYQPPFFKGQHGIVGRALGGWTFSSIFTAGTGSPIEFFTSTGDGQEYGAGDNINFFGNENAVQIAPIKGGHRYNQPGGFPNIFQAGGAVAINDFRNPILGLDNKDGGNGNYIGLNYWNMDFSVRKNVLITEGVSLEFQGVFANVLNHNQFLDPVGVNGSGLFSGGSFGSLVGGSAQEQIGGIRQIELGARVRF